MWDLHKRILIHYFCENPLAEWCRRLSPAWTIMKRGPGQTRIKRGIPLAEPENGFALLRNRLYVCPQLQRRQQTRIELLGPRLFPFDSLLRLTINADVVCQIAS